MSLNALIYALSAASPSLWEEIWAYIEEKYFTMDWYSYNFSYISVSDSGLISIRTGVAALLLGVKGHIGSPFDGVSGMCGSLASNSTA